MMAGGRWGGVERRCSGRISGPSESRTARSMTLRSSRTLPGQAWRLSSGERVGRERGRSPPAERPRELGDEAAGQSLELHGALAQRAAR